MWIAHRGYSARAPENTLRAFREAEQAGAHAIELDVQVTRKGTPVVFHDQLTHRLTRIKGRLTARSLAELRSFKVQKKKIPTLEEALRRTSVPIFLEVKDPHGINNILNAAQQHRERVTVISFYPHVLKRARVQGFKTGLLTLGGGAVGHKVAAMLKTDYLAVHGKQVSQRTLDECRKKGIKPLAWGVTDAKHAEQLLQRGAHGIISDEPLGLTQRFKKVA